MVDRNVVPFLGYRMYSGSCRECVDDVRASTANEGAPVFVASLNPHSIVTAKRDAEFLTSLRRARYLLPDGIGVVHGARILGTPVHERIAGMEFFMEMSRNANERGGVKYFFVGSTNEVLERIVRRLRSEFPNIEVAGTLSPPFVDRFSAAENNKMVSEINAAAPDILWVGMTAPKQEKWIGEVLPRLNVGAVVAVGAVFDFYAGTRKRAPKWVCDLGLEWLPRLIREPRRLWYRNFVSTPLYIYIVIKELVAMRRSAAGGATG